MWSRYAVKVIAVMASSVLCYDHIITFGEEYERYWTWPVTWSAALFFGNRYLAIPAQIVGIAPIILDWDEQVERFY